jgi:hypothetical protein
MLIGATGRQLAANHPPTCPRREYSAAYPIQISLIYKIIERHYRVTPNKTFLEFCAPSVDDFRSALPDIIDARTLVQRLTDMRTRSAT